MPEFQGNPQDSINYILDHYGYHLWMLENGMYSAPGTVIESGINQIKSAAAEARETDITDGWSVFQVQLKHKILMNELGSFDASDMFRNFTLSQ